MTRPQLENQRLISTPRLAANMASRASAKEMSISESGMLRLFGWVGGYRMCAKILPVEIKLQLQSPLLRLPSELRNMVFEFVFVDNGNLHMLSNDPARDTRRLRRLLKLNSLRNVCQQLRLETAGMDRNTFTMHDFGVIRRLSVFGDNAKVVVSCTTWSVFITASFHNLIRLCREDPKAEVHVLANMPRFLEGVKDMYLQGCAQALSKTMLIKL
ncbi:hypothetical protein GMOD_00006459 [Pyrenophora seminiperda CCB06]|uniref:F-box domain-containing protein n=1 Tax=Pyrenophora seminiperda CCB06 TaxID=1302712 RepID=A0A3M7M576_9PLEO|nr:hypothetical protein GMOD_00006459 [Pyrenophora seminiperda CCB06]